VRIETMQIDLRALPRCSKLHAASPEVTADML